MAIEPQKIVTVGSLPGQIFQQLPDSDTRPADNDRVVQGASGIKLEDISGGVYRTSIAKIRAMGANGIPDANANLIYKTMDFGIPGDWNVDKLDKTTLDDTGSCLVTAGGTRLKRRYDGYINILAFGGKGDTDAQAKVGTDNSPALQAAVNYINTLDAAATVGGSTFRDFPAIYFPHGRYKFSTPITNVGRCFQIIGNGSLLMADMSTATPFDQLQYFISGSGDNKSFWNTNIRDCTFAFFDYGIKLENGNIAAASIVFDRVTWMGGKICNYINCQSTRAVYNRCKFHYVTTGFYVVNCDDLVIKDPIVKLNDFVAGDFFVNVKGTTSPHIYIDNLYGTPGNITNNTDYKNAAWINAEDVSSIRCTDSRFGGENNGMVALISSITNVHTGFPTMIQFERCDLLNSVSTSGMTHLSPILLKNVPNQIKIAGCSIVAGMKVIDWHPDVNGATVVAAISQDRKDYPSNLTINIDGNSAFDIATTPDLRTKYGDVLPVELDRFSLKWRRNVPLQLTVTNIDASYWKDYYTSISADTTFTITNAFRGKELSILFSNTDTSQHVITITGVLFGNGSSFSVPASSSVQVKISLVNNVLIGWINITPTAQTGVSGPLKIITTDYTLILSDYTVIYTGSATGLITLPDPTTCKDKIFVINCRYQGGSITTSRSLREDTSTTTTDIATNTTVTIQSDGTEWWIISIQPN